MTSITILQFDLAADENSWWNTSEKPLYHNDCATWCIMISVMGAGGEGVTSLLDYALMTILDQLLTRQRFSLVNWITYKMESHAPHDFGFIQSIRRWWTRDEGAEWYSVFITANSLVRRIGSNGELDREAPGVTISVINIGATVMCEYMDRMVNYSLFNSSWTGLTGLSLKL